MMLLAGSFHSRRISTSMIIHSTPRERSDCLDFVNDQTTRAKLEQLGLHVERQDIGPLRARVI